MSSLSEHERRDFWEICEDRCQLRSTILTSHLPVSRWHDRIGDPTLAESADPDSEMTRRKAFPAILRDRSYRKPIE